IWVAGSASRPLHALGDTLIDVPKRAAVRAERREPLHVPIGEQVVPASVWSRLAELRAGVPAATDERTDLAAVQHRDVADVSQTDGIKAVAVIAVARWVRGHDGVRRLGHLR